MNEEDGGIVVVVSVMSVRVSCSDLPPCTALCFESVWDEEGLYLEHYFREGIPGASHPLPCQESVKVG